MKRKIRMAILIIFYLPTFLFAMAVFIACPITGILLMIALLSPFGFLFYWLTEDKEGAENLRDLCNLIFIESPMAFHEYWMEFLNGTLKNR